jgi:hypothetical protein
MVAGVSETSTAPAPSRADWLAVARRLVESAGDLARAYAERAPSLAGLESAGVALGAIAAARAARTFGRATSWGDRFVDGVGRPTTLGEPHPHPGDGAAWVDHDAPSALAVVTLSAIARGLGPRVEVGPRSRRTRALIEAALEPLAGRFELVDCDAASSASALRVEGAQRSMVSQGLVLGSRPSAVFVAPYYYDKRDLARMVESTALEAVAPGLPASELVLLLPRGWDQANAFADRVTARVEACPTEQRLPIVVRTLDALGPAESVDAALESVRALQPAALGAFVHPLWRERAEVARSLETLERDSGAVAIAIHHGPSLAWRLGSASILGGARVRVEAPVAVAALPSSWRARARLRHEASPGLLGGLGQGALARLGL